MITQSEQLEIDKRMVRKEPTAPLRLNHIPLVNKSSWILNKVKGKSVLHAGPTDFPMTEGKAQNGTLLHLHMQGLCKDLVGVDLSASSIEWLRSNYSVDDIIFGNIEELDLIFPTKKFDVIVAGDVIEHINNVGGFYEAARKVLAPGGIIVVTVPNAFSIKKLLGVLLFKQERNHPDHLYYFTPLTFEQIAYRFGFNILEMAGFMIDAPERKENRFANFIVRSIMKITRNHYLADELAVVLKPAR